MRGPESHGNSILSHQTLGFLNGEFTEMKNAGSQDRICFSDPYRIDHVDRVSCTTAGNHRYIHCVAHRRCNRQIVTILGTVAVHAGEDNFASSQPLDFAGPCDRFEAGRGPPPVNVDLPELFPVPLNSLRIDVDDDTLGAESLGGLTDKLGILASGRVDAHFVTPGLQQLPNVVDRSNTTPDRERHENLLGGPPDDIQHDPSVFMAGSDVEKNELIGSLGLISLRYLHGVPGIAKIEKVGPFHHSSAMDVQARDNAFGEHLQGLPWGLCGGLTCYGFVQGSLELIEQVAAVMRTRRCLRMILNAECIEGLVTNAGDGVVVQVPVGDFQAIWK